MSDVRTRLDSLVIDLTGDEPMTLVALPTKALEDLRDIWEGNDGKSTDYTDIVRAVRDVFDGSDGMLHRIDGVLGTTGRR